MAEPNGRGGWDLTDADVAEIIAVNWPDAAFTVANDPCPVCGERDGGHNLGDGGHEIHRWAEDW